MVHLDLSESELNVLREVLENEISDLGMEISNTDKLDFRDKLKERKRVLQKTLAAISG